MNQCACRNIDIKIKNSKNQPATKHPGKYDRGPSRVNGN
jgi:hypothetical protein